MGSKPKIISILVVFLLDCLLILFLLKHRNVRAFLNKKNKDCKQRKFLK